MSFFFFCGATFGPAGVTVRMSESAFGWAGLTVGVSMSSPHAAADATGGRVALMTLVDVLGSKMSALPDVSPFLLCMYEMPRQSSSALNTAMSTQPVSSSTTVEVTVVLRPGWVPAGASVGASGQTQGVATLRLDGAAVGPRGGAVGWAVALVSSTAEFRWNV